MEHAIIPAQQTSAEYSRISNGFQCFVCGTGFASNDERVQSSGKRITWEYV